MKPNSLLTDRDYDSLLDELLKSRSPEDFLNACEVDFLPVNQSFYPLLLDAIGRKIGAAMNDLGRFLLLPDNRGFDYKEARRIFIDAKLEETKDLVERRAQAFAKKNDWRQDFKERLLALLLSDAERALKKDADSFLKELADTHPAYRNMELQRIIADSAYKEFRILRAQTGGLEKFLSLEIHKRFFFLRKEPDHIYDAASQIQIGKDYTVYLNGLLAESRLKILQGIQNEQLFFYTDEGMQKAFGAAHLAGLTHEDGTWCYTGDKTHGVTIFWKAAVAARLAKADAPGYKVAPFLKDRFRLDSLGKNAIAKSKRIDEYDRELQEIYNKLLHSMGK